MFLACMNTLELLEVVKDAPELLIILTLHLHGQMKQPGKRIWDMRRIQARVIANVMKRPEWPE